MSKKRSKKRVVFIVQSEGRGHMTQALALKAVFDELGWQVVCTSLAMNKGRIVPDYFYENINNLVVHHKSPKLLRDRNSKALRLFRSFLYNLWHSPAYLSSLGVFDFCFKEMKPSLVISFHDMMTGIYLQKRKPGIPVISVAHQYLYLHPDFNYLKLDRGKKWPLDLINKWSVRGSTQQWALSYQKYDDAKNLKVLPPLLRPEIRELTVEKGNYYLMYLTNPGYADEIEAWHQQHPDQEIRVFWENEERIVSPKLHFYAMNDKLFLQALAGCKGLICNAGFESICEAKYLGKPVMFIPVKNHYEQNINALEAEYYQAGKRNSSFNLDDFEQFCDQYQPDHAFKKWVDSATDQVQNHLIELLGDI